MACRSNKTKWLNLYQSHILNCSCHRLHGRSRNCVSMFYVFYYAKNVNSLLVQYLLVVSLQLNRWYVTENRYSACRIFMCLSINMVYLESLFRILVYLVLFFFFISLVEDIHLLFSFERPAKKHNPYPMRAFGRTVHIVGSELSIPYDWKHKRNKKQARDSIDLNLFSLA